MSRTARTYGRCRGFSLLEMIIVMAIMMVVAALATPSIVDVVANMRLRAGMSSLSGLLQNARMTAVKTNRIKSVKFAVLANGPVACIKDVGVASGCGSGDPMVQLGAPVTKVGTPSGSGAPTALGSAALSFSPDATNPPSFNPNGLPCVYSASSPGSCPATGFVFYFTDVRPLGKNGWAAVTISPAGRVKTWYWNGTAWAS
jgi:prepilin-type N-terminal cleavage/methylation domain-containing protein